MAQTLDKLSQRILGLKANLERNANEIVKAAARAYVTEVIDASPVDTGRMVSSWKVGLNYSPRGTRLFSAGVKGSTAEANRTAVKAAVLPTIDARVTGQTIYIANDTYYLKFVNGGEYERFVKSALDRATSAARQRKLFT